MDEAVRQYFNEKATGWMERCWKAFFAGEDSAMHARLEALLDATAITSGSRVLDVGCGDGFLVPFILERIGPEGALTEVDIAENMIAQNRKRHQDSRIRFQVADVSELEPTQDYNAVIAFSCFPHFQDQLGVLEALRGQLRAQGRLGICHTKSAAEMNAFHGTVDPAVSKHRLPHGEAMRNLMCQAGLQPRIIIDRPGLYLATASSGPGASSSRQSPVD